MFDYDKFKAAARRYRHETAFDTDGGRISYAGLSASVTAAYNSLCLAGASGRDITLCTRDLRVLITVSLACSRAGCALTVADERLCTADAALLASRAPALVILPACELSRLGPLFLEGGCRSAMVTGRSDKRIFPSQFDYDGLLTKNDFLIEKQAETAGSVSFFADGEPCEPPETDLPQRTPVAVMLPAFCGRAGSVCSALLYGGRRISLTSKPQRGAAVCTRSDAPMYEGAYQPVLTVPDGAMYAGGGLFDAEKIASRVAAFTGERAECDFDGERVRVILHTAGEHKLTPDLRALLSDLLYPYLCKKSLVFRTKTN